MFFLSKNQHCTDADLAAQLPPPHVSALKRRVVVVVRPPSRPHPLRLLIAPSPSHLLVDAPSPSRLPAVPVRPRRRPHLALLQSHPRVSHARLQKPKRLPLLPKRLPRLRKRLPRLPKRLANLPLPLPLLPPLLLYPMMRLRRWTQAGNTFSRALVSLSFSQARSHLSLRISFMP